MTTTLTDVALDPGQPEPEAVRWPLKPLLDATRLTIRSLAAELGMARDAVAIAGRRGLSDVQADEWAIRLGLHPVVVWGWTWVAADATACASPQARVARELRAAIEGGELVPGDRLPTVAALAKRVGVGTGSVTLATTELRRERLLVRSSHGLTVADPATLPSRPCDECGEPIAPSDEHYPHRPDCTLEAAGWCDCDHVTHPRCCPTCTTGAPA